MDYSRILVIAPYPELAEEAKKTVQLLKKSCQVLVADMSDGAEAAKQAYMMPPITLTTTVAPDFLCESQDET